MYIIWPLVYFCELNGILNVIKKQNILRRIKEMLIGFRISSLFYPDEEIGG